MEENKVISNEDLESVSGGLTGSWFDIHLTCTECGTQQVIRKSKSRYSPGEHWDNIGNCCTCNATIYFLIPRGPAKFVKEDTK